jgi:hypothetical protein
LEVVTLPKLPFDLPPATVDETAPRFSLTKRGARGAVDESLTEPDWGDIPVIDAADGEGVPWTDADV